VDGLWATKSEGVELIVRAICFQDIQLMWSWSTNVTYWQTDRRTDGQRTCSLNTALCTILHRAIKTTIGFVINLFYYEVAKTKFWSGLLRLSYKTVSALSIDQLSDQQIPSVFDVK